MPPQPVVVPVWLVDDGNHRGIVMPAESAPLRPDLRFPVAGAKVAYVEYGYGDRAWIDGSGRSLDHVLQLATSHGDGVVVVQTWSDLDSALSGRSYTRAECSREQIQELAAELSEWIDPSGSVGILEGEYPLYVITSTKPYTLLHNCRWFIERVTRRMDLEVEPKVGGSVNGASEPDDK